LVAICSSTIGVRSSLGQRHDAGIVHQQIKASCSIATADVLAKFPHRIELGKIKICEM
jgi:hypothetical protein